MGIIDNFKKRFTKPPAKPLPRFDEVALSELYGMFSGGKASFQKYNPNDLFSQKGMSIVDSMRKDDQIKAAMGFKKSIVLASGWEVVSPVDQDDDWEVTVFVNDVLSAIDGTIERKILEILTALEYGFSITEKIWRKDGNRIILSGLKTKYPHDITFEVDAYGNIKHINQNNDPLPLDKFVIYSYDKEFDNPYGKTDLEAAYRPWWAKDNAYKWMAMLLERLGIPPIFAMYDPESYDSDSLSKLQDVISNFQAGTVGVLPRPVKEALEMWSPQIANNVGNVFIPAIEMMNKDIARSVLMPGLLGMTPDENVGSNARSQTHLDAFFLTVERIRCDLQEHAMMEQIIKPLVDYNFNVDQYPLFKFLPISDDTRTDIIEVWNNLTGNGVVQSKYEDEQHIRKSLKFPEREKDDSDDNPVDDPELNPGPDEIQDEDIGEPEFALGRQADMLEAGINFAAIGKSLDTSDSTLVDKIKEQLRLSLSDLEKSISRAESLEKFTEELTLKRFNKIRSILKDDLKQVMMQGYNDAEVDAPRDFSEKTPGFILTRAIKWLLLKVGIISNSLKGKLEADVKNVLVESIRTGALLTKTIENLRNVYEPYVGKDNVIRDDKVISPHRLETVIRTNTTGAYNQGRLVMFRENEHILKGVRYSAILDSRTTEICSHLDKKIFKVNDPALDRLAPANHFNCRSLLIPIIIGRDVNESDFITPDQSGKGVRLAGSFAGE